MKKVIFLLIDSLMPHILNHCLQEKTIPAIQFLKERGRYWPDCVTVFPTMTASVDSSLVTGCYPNVHRVPGLIWYDPEEKAIIDYVNGWQCVWKLGISNCARNVLYNLNEKHLSKNVTTIFEELASRGKTSASINTVVHRGTKKHRMRLPFLMNLATGFRFHDDISGPDIMTLGAMVQTNIKIGIPRSILTLRNHCGINDRYAVHVAKNLIQSKNQPDFMLVYLPDNDHLVHKKNPDHAEGGLIRVDQRIQEMLNVFDSWDGALRQCIFIVTGDHGQTRIGKHKEFNIDLDKLLERYRLLQLGENPRDHDLVVCNNERSAYLYPLKPEKQEGILQQLLSESRIDLIAWKRQKGVVVWEGGSGREIYFEPGGPNIDIYGSAWTIKGEWSVLDLRSDRGIVNYGDYPDALARLYGALYSQEIPFIVVTARPRYEFLSRFYPRHLNGGCHGSLHRYDSLVPLIVSGTDHHIHESPRLVDLKKFILELFETQGTKSGFHPHPLTVTPQ